MLSHRKDKAYNLVRFVDRDMLMRFHWGHGVGHTYTHTTVLDVSLPSFDIEDPAIREHAAGVAHPKEGPADGVGFPHMELEGTAELDEFGIRPEEDDSPGDILEDMIDSDGLEVQDQEFGNDVEEGFQGSYD